jgi:hypothetical protein
VLTPATAVDVDSLPRIKIDLVDPPFVHAHEQVATGGPKVVEFTMNIIEKKIALDDNGAEYWASTFNGTVPGPLMVVHEGDYVELTLVNPPETGLETWFIPGGTAGLMIYTFEQPGVYAYVNHNLIEAFELGAAAHVVVKGDWNDDLMKLVEAPAAV